MAFTNIKLEVYVNAGWTDISADVLMSDPPRLRYGNWEYGPLARVAQTGTLQFSLDNSTKNIGGLKGYYTPGHTNCLAGFTRGINVQLTFYYTSGGPVSKVKHLGKLQIIEPEPGQYGSRVTRCVSLDWMDQLAEYYPVGLGSLGVGLSLTNTPAALELLVESMPSNAQPLVAPDYGTSADVLPYVFHDSQNESALTLAARLTLSEYGYLDMDGSGTLAYHNRHEASLEPSQVTFSDSTITRIEVAAGSRETTYNYVSATVHPKRLDGYLGGSVLASLRVLWRAETEPPMYFAAGQTYTWVAEYFDEDDTTLSGSLVTPAFSGTPVAGTDYVFNTQADGLGTSFTTVSGLSVSWYATHARITLTPAYSGYAMTFQLRGLGAYDLSPVTLEAIGDTYRRRHINLDLPYQGEPTFGQALADLLLARYKDEVRQVRTVTFNPHDNNDANLNASMQIEPGEVVTISETMTGISSEKYRVCGVELVLGGKKNEVSECTWSVQPAFSYGTVWQLDDATYSVLGTTTVLGSV